MNKFATLFVFGICFSLVSAQDQPQESENTTTAYFLWSLGNLVESRHPNYVSIDDQYLNNEWFYTLTAGILVKLKPSERLELISNLEASTYHKYPRRPYQGDGENSQSLRYSTYIESAGASYKFGNLDAPPFVLNLGFLYFQYNTDAKTFGEYLFRTMVYPSLVFNGFDYPWARITGMQLENQLLPNLKHNLIVTTETNRYPFFDFSLAYVAEYKLGEILTVGAGANMKRLLPVRPSLTTPTITDNVYYHIPAQGDIAILNDSGGVEKTVTINEPINGYLEAAGRREPIPNELIDLNTGDIYPQIQGSKTTYSFAGTILMGRFAVNPLGTKESFLGEEALKLYFEGAVLGWKNYPGLYENRDERTVYMGGIRLPTFNLLNTLALEVEYFPSKIAPSDWYRAQTNLPHPGAEKFANFTDSSATALENSRLDKDNIKWSLYARKNFRGFSLIFGAGRDHMRKANEEGQAHDEVLTRPAHWYWQMRMRTHF